MSSWKSAFPLEYLAVKPPVLLRFAGIHVLCVILLPWNRENEKSSEALTISWANKDWEGWEQRLSAQSMAGSVRSSSSVTLAELWILPINQMRDKTIFLCCVFWVFLLLSLIPGCSLSVSSYKVPFRLSDTSVSVPWLLFFLGLLFRSFFVKDRPSTNK